MAYNSKFNPDRLPAHAEPEQVLGHVHPIRGNANSGIRLPRCSQAEDVTLPAHHEPRRRAPITTRPRRPPAPTSATAAATATRTAPPTTTDLPPAPMARQTPATMTARGTTPRPAHRATRDMMPSGRLLHRTMAMGLPHRDTMADRRSSRDHRLRPRRRGTGMTGRR